jgi:murein L,D-transpeptidase YafK
LNQAFVRALLASAAVAATIALAGCDPDSVAPSGRSQAPLSEKMLAELDAKQMNKDSPILVRIFKEESEMEVWKKNRGGEFALLKTYPICRWSGDLGPKKKEGDRQAPEGFYTITPGQMNPHSNYYLAFNTGFPNTYDRAMGYTGSQLMVHGDCSSRGCYAMTDEQIQEIYTLARESFFGGQTAFQFEAFPFRMTSLNMAKHRNNPNFAFWEMLKEGYDHFEATHQEPKVAVCEKRYIFDAAPSDNSNRPLKFDAHSKCPVFQLDPTIASVVLDHIRQERVQMAQYIARDVATVPPRTGIDGGMNPVFLAKLQTQTQVDNNGRTIQLAGNTQAPGYLPRTPNPPAAAAERPPQSQPAAKTERMASVPTPAPQPKDGEAPSEQPKTIAGLLDNLFSNKAETKPAEAADAKSVTVELAPKPRRANIPVRTAATSLQSKPQEKPKTVANASPAAPRVQKAETAPASAPELRTAYSAYSAPQANTNGLVSGAQPVVPAGSFESRWAAFR